MLGTLIFTFTVHLTRNVDTFIAKNKLLKFIDNDVQRFSYVKDYSAKFTQIVRMIKIMPFIPKHFVMGHGFGNFDYLNCDKILKNY